MDIKDRTQPNKLNRIATAAAKIRGRTRSFLQSPYFFLAAAVSLLAVSFEKYEEFLFIVLFLLYTKFIVTYKPICTTLEEYEEIKKLSKKKNLKIACMFDLRYLPVSQRARKFAARTWNAFSSVSSWVSVR